MEAYEWFDKRDALAEAFGVEPREVPPEAVWFLNLDYSLTEEDKERTREIYKSIKANAE